MRNKALMIVVALVCALGFMIPAATNAAVSENALSFNNPWSAGTNTNGTLYFSVYTPDLTTHIFQEKDPGTPEIISTINDPANRRFIYVSVRIDLSADGMHSGPFITKIFRYDLETGKMLRVYRVNGGSGYQFLGFDGRKLLLVASAYGDNSPGPGWLDEELAKSTLTYINVNSFAAGVKTYKPSAKFHNARVKIFNDNWLHN